MNVSAYFFGRFRVQVGEVVLDHTDSSRALELLAYVLMQRPRVHSRETLANLFWGDHSTTTQSKKYLRNALWMLQKAIDENLHPDRNLLNVSSDSVSINPESQVWLDVEVFDTTYAAVEDVPPDQISDNEELLTELKDAVDLYSGHFLDGWFQEWCLRERERLLLMLLIALDKLMVISEHREEYETGIRYGERSLAFDRAREVTHQNLMRLFYLSGDRTGALRQFEMCRELLRDELDIAPSERTEALADAIRSDRTLD